MLNEFNAKNAQFRILPQYKVKSEGEVVRQTSDKFYVYMWSEQNWMIIDQSS